MATKGSSNVRVEGQNSPSQAHLPSVLIVDDSHSSANNLSRLLTAHGYKTNVAYDWEEAIEAAKAHLHDVILLDLGMPELDGIHLARFFRDDDQLKDKILIAVTGFADDWHRSQCKEAGFNAVLAKPAIWEDLTAAIDRFWAGGTTKKAPGEP